MNGLSALLLFWLAAIGPNGEVLLPALDRSLPVRAFTEFTPRLWVVLHHNRDLPMAFYSPAERRDPSFWLRVKDPDMERLLPGLRVPRIFLYAPYYRPGARLSSATEMTVDVAQYFSETLLEAFFDLSPPDGFEERAQHYGPGYISALAQFGSDVFSIAVELRRSLQRQRAAGKDPCVVASHPATLFSRWQRIFTTAPYRGLYDPPGHGPARLGPPLSRGDKSFLIDKAFANFWAGDLQRDFGLDCP